MSRLAAIRLTIRRRRRQDRTGNSRDPFSELGLEADPALTDDEIRAAWRRIAAATHPDRADGGDPARYAAAAAAYTELRTRYGRGEALAARAKPAVRSGRLAARRPDSPHWRTASRMLARLPGRIARGRPVRLALRSAAAVAVAWAALAAGAPRGAGPALAAGAVTWLILTGRQDLAP